MVYITIIAHQSDCLALAICTLIVHAKLAAMTDDERLTLAACWGVVRSSLATLSV